MFNLLPDLRVELKLKDELLILVLRPTLDTLPWLIPSFALKALASFYCITFLANSLSAAVSINLNE